MKTTILLFPADDRIIVYKVTYHWNEGADKSEACSASAGTAEIISYKAANKSDQQILEEAIKNRDLDIELEIQELEEGVDDFVPEYITDEEYKNLSIK